MAPYKFLQVNQVRLLSVQRKDDGSLAGKLKTISIEDSNSRDRFSEKKKLDYFAISYVWGSREHDKTIEIDGHPVTITLNAYTVLGLFCDWPRQRDRRTWVWIDAVCINQEDVLEKNIQVPLMASIYGRAKRTVVWLGESNEQTDQGMDLMRALATGKQGYPVPQSVAKSSAAWAGFEEIASRPWWIRAWTLQESVIPSDTVYYCGTKSLTADEVRSAVLVASSYQYTKTDVQLSKAIWAPLWHRRRIYQWLGHQNMDDDFDGYERRRPPTRGKLGQISLPALLAYQRHSLSTNPKDYIYSLLGCIKDKDRQLVGPPAYDSSTAEVYRTFVRSWVLAYQSLDIIAFAELFPRSTSVPSPENRLPSWAPDWSARLELASEESNAVPLLVSQPTKDDIGSMLPPRFLRRSADDYYHENDDCLPKYAASGKMAMRVSFSKDLTKMTCTGILIDTIDGISGVDPDEPISVELPTSSTNLNNDGASPEHMRVANHIIRSLCFGRQDVYLQYEIGDDDTDVTEADYALREPMSENDKDFVGWVNMNADFKIRGVTVYDALTHSEKLEKAMHERVDAERASEVQAKTTVSIRSSSPRRRSPSPLPLDRDLSNDSDGRPIEFREYARLTAQRRGSSPRRRSPSPSSAASDDSDSSEKIEADEEASRHDLNRKFRTATHPNWMARRLAVTNDGHVGMVTKKAQKDDVICVLFGCSVPMVLRPAGDQTYEVVGECYLHGFMEGQILGKDYRSTHAPVNLTLV